MSLSWPTCQRLCWPAQFGVGWSTRETRVKPVMPALVARETCVKRLSCPLRRQPRPQRRDLATSSNNTTPQPRGISRKARPGLVARYEPG